MDTDISTQEALFHCITETQVEGFPDPYKGKVREVYTLDGNTLGIVVSDRISAFDYIMRQAIPFKGQILNQLAAFSFEKVKDIVATHVIDVPHPNVTIAKKCEPVPIEVVVRGYLTGHAWREYKAGKRKLCGVAMPNGLKEHDRFPSPILTPATKAEEGHDEDISEEEILSRGIVSAGLWNEIKETAFALFERGTQVAAEQDLILVDTKYEFGTFNGELTLIDEVHTTDSSRYFYKDGYEERQAKGEPQKQLSKEFLREWLMEHDFQGKENQTLPDLPDDFRMEVFERYAELFEMLTGKAFEPYLEKDINIKLKDIFEAAV
ncbi:phosphoribosylaminoimidazolesuccinocarboxamide synthase [Gracilimonas mengyeensis]|uniref:Phosphoribosylaminoimidazole-succinocarboxamide synthase n=1 Tax=Gracilimonas mengyeensis TaxID=1302730 RepID=A0A521ATH5_9BACT|nr:phosphoribosylaminoimidazolesuccinocarboxamide synthase [Gracilimonas mengyeensis]SMO38168.1 phosphoribosylaminoimidazole-succinocarboxamide synthase [Gracilimonas mengyeensis]